MSIDSRLVRNQDRRSSTACIDPSQADSACFPNLVEAMALDFKNSFINTRVQCRCWYAYFWRFDAYGAARLGHMYCGYKQAGKIILSVSAALILIFALTVGSALGTWALGIALGLHVISVMHLPLLDVNGPRVRFGYLVVVYTALMFMYSVGWMTIQRVINPITIVQSVGQFSQGDVVFSSQAASPNVGRLVQYQLPTRDVLVRRPDGQRRYRFEERAFDRILASEGQSYSISKGRLIVDGVESLLRPTNGEIPSDITASGVVPPGHWLILPGTVPNAYFVEPLSRIAIVDKSNVDGVLFLKRNSIFSWNFL